MKIYLPEDVEYIIDTLMKAGYEAYAVGGCVRDSMLCRTPDDWDITTSARPEMVKRLFPRTFDTGIAHGTVTVMLRGNGYEVTTYRVDGEYEDGRHPKEVVFTASLTEDLKRRDFTINAMAYNEEEGVVDEFDGMTDLQRGMIRCVGDARERFTEDALRMMRAVRFSAQLGYGIETETMRAIRALAPSLAKISAERIQSELTKLVTSPHPDYLKVAWKTGITAVILPEFDRMMDTPQNNPHHIGSVGEHTLAAMRAAESDKVVRLAVLFHDIGKPGRRTTGDDGIDHFHGHAAAGSRMTEEIMRRLKFDNDTIDQVSRLVLRHDEIIKPEERVVRRALHRIGKDIFPLLIKVKYADAAGQSDFGREEKLQSLEALERVYRRILEQHDCISLKDLAIGGRDLIEAGMKPGPKLGETLNTLLELVLEEPARNTREYLLSNLPKKT